MTVTVMRIDQELFSVPDTAYVLKREYFLERRAVRTLPDTLGEIPGVMV